MFGLSFGELVIIAILALVLLGPDRLPDAAKQAGKLMRQFKAATDDLKDQLETEMYKAEREIVRPALVPPVSAQPVSGPAGPPPTATPENVPGLEAALVDASAADAVEPAAASAAPVAPDAPAPAVAAPPRSDVA